MIAATAFIAVVQGLSLLLMLLTIHLFKRQWSKYDALLRGMGDETALGVPGRFIVPAYAAVTLAVAGITLYLFVFQPHLL